MSFFGFGKKHEPSQKSAELTIELAKAFATEMHNLGTPWIKAYMRFEAGDDWCGCKGSYTTADGAILLDVFKHKDLMRRFQELGPQLREELSHNGKRFCVTLLTLDADMNYEFLYEYNDANKWAISKLDGASGVPDGV